MVLVLVRRSLTLAALAGGTLLALALVAAPLEAQGKPAGKARDRAATARGASDPAQDENIRTLSGVNIRGETGELPPDSKFGSGNSSRSRSSCKVHYDNRTSLYIAVYAEGIFRGDVSPWGDLHTFVVAGPTRLYARAGFTDGSVSTWGPRLVECPAGKDFKWMLHQ
jgi:hypothetical protein